MNDSRSALLKTISITLALFSFIIFLLYIIYCYAYYDKNQEQVFLDNVNQDKYSFVYEKLVGKDSLTFEQYKAVLNRMYNKDNLENIYNTYYRDNSDITMNEFMAKYLFFNNLEIDDLVFGSNGKTNLFTRRAIFYDEIHVKSEKLMSNIGVVNKITLNKEKNSSLIVDNMDIECLDNFCTIDKMYGGIHEVNYISNGYQYYGLINMYKDMQVIDITNLDSLVNIGVYGVVNDKVDDLNIQQNIV